MNTTYYIYHANCPDGFTSAWLFDRFSTFSGSNIFIPATHGKPIDFKVFDKDDEVFLLDFSFDYNSVVDLASKVKKVTILDHHKTAKDALTPLLEDRTIEGVIDTDECGCSLSFKYLLNDSLTNLVKYVKDRDLWKFELPHSKEVNAFISSFEYTIANWDYLFLLLGSDKGIASAEVHGASIMRTQTNFIKQVIDSGLRKIKVGGYEVDAVNVPHMWCSEAAEMLINKGNKFGCCFYIVDNTVCYSLRSKGNFDVSAIAKKYGGGGHKNAAGFKLPLEGML